MQLSCDVLPHTECKTITAVIQSLQDYFDGFLTMKQTYVMKGTNNTACHNKPRYEEVSEETKSTLFEKSVPSSLSPTGWETIS